MTTDPDLARLVGVNALAQAAATSGQLPGAEDEVRRLPRQLADGDLQDMMATLETITERCE